MIKRLVAIVSIVMVLILGAPRPAHAVLCWYCTSSTGTCFKGVGSWQHIGGTGCTSGGSQGCVLSGLCPFTLLEPIGFDAGGSPIEGCSNQGPFKKLAGEVVTASAELTL